MHKPEGDGMTTQRNHPPEVRRGTQPLVIPEPARPARTLLIFSLRFAQGRLTAPEGHLPTTPAPSP
ncbi:hypothetical protein GCM10022380_28130 [Amycolatopsis tucumanensis]|uniref:Uncharacterized protein n=1 Tax=Amycolatopsis tucumanensis TaxID=401106 RepID=A0ABP7I3C7_9PSEU